MTHRLRLAAAPLVRAACLTLAALVLSGCGNLFDPSNTTTSTEPPINSQPPPAETGNPPPTGKASVTLSWTRPSQNADGSALDDLAGYRIYYSQAPWGWSSNLNVQDPATTSIEIPNLSTGTWYFTMTSYNAAGVESERTGYVSKML